MDFKLPTQVRSELRDFSEWQNRWRSLGSDVHRFQLNLQPSDCES